MSTIPKYFFDFDKIKTEEDFYKVFAEEFALPEYFGYNLDALYDMITGFIDLPAEVHFIDISREQLQQFQGIVTAMEDAAAQLTDEFLFETHLKSPPQDDIVGG